MIEKMLKRLFVLLGAVVIISAANLTANAQSRKSVSAAEVTGTFRDYFGGRFKGNYNEIKILALGRGLVKISFGLTYPFIDGTGNMSANVGEASGEATISGDEAVYENKEFGECRIVVKFVKSGSIRVTQQGTDGNCGFGFDVSASGDYKKTSRAKPKF